MLEMMRPEGQPTRVSEIIGRTVLATATAMWMGTALAQEAAGASDSAKAADAAGTTVTTRTDQTARGGAGAGVPKAHRDAIRQAVQGLLPAGADAKVDDIRLSPIPGIYEVRVAQHLLYMDGKGEYAFLEANLLDLKNKRNLTQERMDDLQRVDFKKDLPLDKAIKQVYGKGERVLAIFEDPNCSYCRRMRTTLGGIDNLTLYTFPYPILSQSSFTKSRQAWCAKDRAAAWSEMMSTGKVPDNDGSCDTAVVDEFLELGRKLQVTGTPTLFFPDGKRVPGAIPAERLEQMLAEQKGS
ncbi:MAG: DsbC family protein [Lautropia sp.]|nr:DsbC family protein [Lautropia sp.]